MGFSPQHVGEILNSICPQFRLLFLRTTATGHVDTVTIYQHKRYNDSKAYLTSKQLQRPSRHKQGSYSTGFCTYRRDVRIIAMTDVIAGGALFVLTVCLLLNCVCWLLLLVHDDDLLCNCSWIVRVRCLTVWLLVRSMHWLTVWLLVPRALCSLTVRLSLMVRGVG